MSKVGHRIRADRRYCSPQQPARSAGRRLHSSGQGSRQKEREREPQTIKDWRQRMTTNKAAAIMKKRGRIERVNVNFKNRGFGTLLVRGLAKVQAIGLWHALSHNLTIALRLRTIAPAAA